MASYTQIVIVLFIGCIAVFALCWQAKEFFSEKVISCPWDMCKYNEDGLCKKKNSVELKIVAFSDEEEGLVCNSFKPPEKGVKKCIDIKT